MEDKEAKQAIDLIIARLKEIRLEQGLSHEKLANKANVHRSTISLIEARKREPTLLICMKIANALNIDLKDIV